MTIRFDLRAADNGEPLPMNGSLWYLKRCDLFDELTPQQTERLNAAAHVRPFKRHDLIYAPTQPGHSVLVVAAGRAALGAAAVLGGAWFLMWLAEETVYDYGGITCPKVVELGLEYAQDDLSKELRDKIRFHVSQCPNCGPYYKEHGWTT